MSVEDAEGTAGAVAEQDYEDDDMREFRHRYVDRCFFTDSLDYDVANAEELFARAPANVFARRTVVRTTFAQVEGLCAEAIDWARYYASEESAHRDDYTIAERAVLAGVAAFVNEKGEARMGTAKYPSAKANTRFALSLVGRGAEGLPPINYCDGGWGALCEGFAVRDRLMHPKKPEDIRVSDDDLVCVRRGRDWLVATIRTRDGALKNTTAVSLSGSLREHLEKKKTDETT
jgi:hypothetical protein